MAWRTRSVEVEYQTLLEEESEWTAPEDLDQFLRNVCLCVVCVFASILLQVFHTATPNKNNNISFNK
jgi:hypothetical protein